MVRKELRWLRNLRVVPEVVRRLKRRSAHGTSRHWRYCRRLLAVEVIVLALALALALAKATVPRTRVRPIVGLRAK